MMLKKGCVAEQLCTVTLPSAGTALSFGCLYTILNPCKGDYSKPLISFALSCDGCIPCWLSITCIMC